MSKPTRIRSRNWCFTSFAKTEHDDWEFLYNKDSDFIRYLCVGIETCPTTGKLHTQGWIQMNTPKEMSVMKKVLGDKTAHLEPCRGTEYKNDDYCTKSGNWKTYGKFKSQGQRTDIEQVFREIKNGTKELEIARLYPVQYMKYHKCIQRLIELTEQENRQKILKAKMEKTELLPWQSEVIDRINNQSDRQVLWVYDEEGNKGKTFLGKYLLAQGETFYTTGGKASDIAYAYNYEKIVFFNFSRDTQERINYGLIEQFKDGLVWSTKYISQIKCCPDTKVVVMANFRPNYDKLSNDRWDILDLSEMAQSGGGNTTAPATTPEEIPKDFTFKL